MHDGIDYQAWALEMCGLLDAIEMFADDPERVQKLVAGRHLIAEKYGLRVVKWSLTIPPAGEQ